MEHGNAEKYTEISIYLNISNAERYMQISMYLILCSASFAFHLRFCSMPLLNDVAGIAKHIQTDLTP